MSDGSDVGLSVHSFLPFQFQLGARAGAPFEKRHKQTIIEGHVDSDANTHELREKEETNVLRRDARGPRKVKAAAAGLRLTRAGHLPVPDQPSTILNAAGCAK